MSICTFGELTILFRPLGRKSNGLGHNCPCAVRLLQCAVQRWLRGLTHVVP